MLAAVEDTLLIDQLVHVTRLTIMVGVAVWMSSHFLLQLA